MTLNLISDGKICRADEYMLTHTQTHTWFEQWQQKSPCWHVYVHKHTHTHDLNSDGKICRAEFLTAFPELDAKIADELVIGWLYTYDKHDRCVHIYLYTGLHVYINMHMSGFPKPHTKTANESGIT